MSCLLRISETPLLRKRFFLLFGYLHESIMMDNNFTDNWYRQIDAGIVIYQAVISMCFQTEQVKYDIQCDALKTEKDHGQHSTIITKVCHLTIGPHSSSIILQYRYVVQYKMTKQIQCWYGTRLHTDIVLTEIANLGYNLILAQYNMNNI